MSAVPAAPSATDDEVAHELFVAFYGRLAGWVRRLVDDDETAHDIATESFTRLLAQAGKVHDPRAWLYTTASNLVRDHWRRSARERVALARVGTSADHVRAGRDAYDLDLSTRTTVRALVEALPERLRQPVLLYYYADLSVGQVATALGKAEGTIKRALFDARALMAAALEDQR
ncbi:MAG TPA: RNA polymerase sigma factor [Actinomycetes bacterium]|nr:RNA polymerase sigma factor [Actinomycetes bacterium]